MANSSARRLTPDEKARIVELKLRRVPVRAIAASELDCQVNTVQMHWNKYIAAHAAKFADTIARVRSELMLRQEQIAIDARRGLEIRYMTVEIAALREIERLSGAAAPVKVEHSGEVITEAHWIEEIAKPDEA